MQQTMGGSWQTSSLATEAQTGPRLSCLRKHCVPGHDVWLDVWKIKLGESIIGQINDGLSGASFLVLCCSDAPSTSPWMDREWRSVLARQLEGAKVRVLPVRLTGKTAAILSDIKYADLARDWQPRMEAIRKALG